MSEQSIETMSPDRPAMNDRPVTRQRWVVGVCWLVALCLGAIQAWAHRHAMGGDGISYMDVASAYVKGDWGHVVNGYWSPLYSWLLAAGLWLFDPSPYWDAAVAHVVNFLVYCFTLGCFHFFWAGLLRLRKRDRVRVGRADLAELPAWAWYALGYSLFVWSSLNLITVSLVTPDLCVAGFLYLLAGMLVRMRMGVTGYRAFACFGIVLALGYLTKFVLLTVGLVFAGVALLLAGRLRRSIPRVALAGIVCAALMCPWVMALSRAKGRLTLGDAGRINYAKMVCGAHPWYLWMGSPPETGTPKHSVRRLHDQPPVFGYDGQVGGSYPLWYDNSYWCDGIKPYFNPRGHLNVLNTTTNQYFDIFFHQQGTMVFCIIVLVLVRGSVWAFLCDAWRLWFVWLPALAGLGLYAIMSVEPRLVGGFVVLFWAPLLYGIRVADTAECRRTLKCVTIGMVVALLTMVGWESIPAVRRTAMDVRHKTDTAPHRMWEVADELNRMGVRPGAKVAHIGQALKSWSYWARLANVRIIAETRPMESFWLADDASRAEVMNLFAGLGVRAVVTRCPPNDERPFGLPVDFAEGWQRIGKTTHYVYLLDSPVTTQPQ